jgi:septal ring factor EnvC (AmiA/AmiB activator)
MTEYRPREDTLATAIDRIEDVREALQAQNRALAIVLKTQQLHGELLGQIHAAVTQQAEADPLTDLLRALVSADAQHAATLQAVLAAVTKGPPP